MKIAFVLHQFLPSYNSGTEQYVYHLAKKLIRQGEQVEVFTYEPVFVGNPPFTGVTKDRFEDIPVTRLSGWLGHFPNVPLAQYYNPLFAKLFGEFLAREEIEVVHFFQMQHSSAALIEEAYLAGIPSLVNLMDFWFLCPAIQLLRPGGDLCAGPDDYKACIDCLAPVDGNFQALYPFIYGEQALSLPEGGMEEVDTDFLASADAYHRVAAMAVRPHLIRDILKLADRVVAPSEFLQSVFVANGYAPERFSLIRYGIDLQGLAGAKKKTSEKFRLGYIGTITPHKGLDTLVKSVCRIEDESISLDVYGDLQGYPSFSEKVLKLAEGEERICFRGRFESAELADVLSRIDLMVVPSVWYENTPFVILEALASGTPVIASNLGGLAELIEEGKNGYLFEPGNVEDLKNKILLWQGDPARQEGFVPDPAKVRSLDDNLADFLAIYRGLAAQGVRAEQTNPERRTEPMQDKQPIDPEHLEDKCARLQRQVHHLTSQVFHMISMNAGQTRRIVDLERLAGDQAFLAEHAPSEASLEIPEDLDPEVRRKLVQLDHVRAILHRRNNLISELERQLDFTRTGIAQRTEEVRSRNETIRDLEASLEEEQRAVESLTGELEGMSPELRGSWRRLLEGVKGIFKGGETS